MNKDIPLIISGIIFAIVGLVHLARLFLKFGVIIAGYEIPLWVSVVACIVSITLAVWTLAVSKS